MPTVLLVDDELDVLELLEFNLRQGGFSVLTARSGPVAIDLAQAHRPDLILLDLMLPELDGMSVCELIRQCPLTAHIPIIMLTAWGTEQSRVLGLELGADDYVQKPFSPRELVLRIRKRLEDRLPRQTAVP
jgi:DNA-binding response OmpR family regulator